MFNNIGPWVWVFGEVPSQHLFKFHQIQNRSGQTADQKNRHNQKQHSGKETKVVNLDE